MRRRALLAALGGASAWRPGAGASQAAGGPARIGYLSTGSSGSPDARAPFDAFRQGMRERGYVEGRDIAIEARWADGRTERFAALAEELVRLGVDVIVATNSLAARAARSATGTIPIVVPVMGDPVGDGLVASLGRPGGNVTGITFLGPQLLPKRLGLLKEALPQASRIAALWHPGAYSERTMGEMVAETEAAAGALGVRLPRFAVQAADEFEAAFARIAAERPDALLVFPSPMLFTERRRLVELATGHRLPSMAMAREFVQLGGLMAYGANITGQHRLVAAYVDRILRGAAPADLPVAQPTVFELWINLGAAKTLGVSIPPALLARADEVVE